MSGVILIYSCQKYKDSRIRELEHLRESYAGWKVFFIVGDPTIETEYILDGRLLTLRCEDSYLHLLKKTLLGFKVALDLVPDATGILKCGDDIIFNERELERFLRDQPKKNYMGLQGSPFVPLGPSHRDTWIVDYYKKHPEDFQNPMHGLPSWDEVSKLTQVPTIQAASGPLTYFSRLCTDILIAHMKKIDWDVLREVPPYGYPYIIEEPGISFILYPNGIYPAQYPLFTETESLFKRGTFVGLHTNRYKWEAPLRICILGAGWYGCHAARVLLDGGAYVHLLDKTGIFAGASAKNQNRLHLGYHYPRSPETIRECQDGHSKFLARYGDCVVPFADNYYLLHKDSVTSASDYRKVFAGFDHREIPVSSLGLAIDHLEDTAFVVPEKFIDVKRVQSRMQREFAPYLEVCGSPKIELFPDRVIVNDIEYDYLLNCTNNQFVPVPLTVKPVYETVCSLLYTLSDQPTPLGLTVMDGPFFSLFPYDLSTSTYTLTHVVHSVLSRGPLEEESLSPETLAVRRQLMESEFATVFPDLLSRLTYVGYFLSTKTKYDFVRDDRSLRWSQTGRCINISGGKITGIVEMEERLRKTIPGLR